MSEGAKKPWADRVAQWGFILLLGGTLLLVFSYLNVHFGEGYPFAPRVAYAFVGIGLPMMIIGIVWRTRKKS